MDEVDRIIAAWQAEVPGLDTEPLAVQQLRIGVGRRRPFHRAGGRDPVCQREEQFRGQAEQPVRAREDDRAMAGSGALAERGEESMTAISPSSARTGTGYGPVAVLPARHARISLQASVRRTSMPRTGRPSNRNLCSSDKGNFQAIFFRLVLNRRALAM